MPKSAAERAMAIVKRFLRTYETPGDRIIFIYGKPCIARIRRGDSIHVLNSATLPTVEVTQLPFPTPSTWDTFRHKQMMPIYIHTVPTDDSQPMQQSTHLQAKGNNTNMMSRNDDRLHVKR